MVCWTLKGTERKTVTQIFKYKLCNVFADRSMYMQQKTGSFRENFSKNIFYRFLINPKINWRRFPNLLSRKVVEVLLVSSKASNLIGPLKHNDVHFLAAHRIFLAQEKGTDVMIELLKTAQEAEHSEKYILFDSWFSSLAQLVAVKVKYTDSPCIAHLCPLHDSGTGTTKGGRWAFPGGTFLLFYRWIGRYHLAESLRIIQKIILEWSTPSFRLQKNI